MQAGIAIAKEGLAIAKDGIDTLDRGLELYNKHLDKIIPWAELNKTLDKLNEFRSDYSEQAAALISEIQTKMYDGMDAYFRATQNIFQWCGLVLDLLEDYTPLLEGEMNQALYDNQRDIILQALDDGIDRMEKGKEELATSSSSFNVAAGKLTQLNRRLSDDFNENSEYYQAQKAHIRTVGYGAAAPFLIFGITIAAGVIEGVLIPELNAKMEAIEEWYEDLRKEVSLSQMNIMITKDNLNREITHIGELQNKAVTARVFIRTTYTDKIKAKLVKSVNNLIAKCNEYRDRHSKANPELLQLETTPVK